MKKKLIFCMFIILPIFAITFQNCSKTEFSTQESSSNLALGGKCKNGEKLAIWSDTNHDGSKDKLLGYIVAYEGQQTAAKNYNYYSASAHPEIGPKPAPFASHVFFYKGPEGLSLNFFHNIDEGGSADNKVYWDIHIKNNNFADGLLLSDDPNEIKIASRSSNSTHYKSYLRYYKNTDGGVIGPLESKNFEIKVNVANGNGDLKNSAFYSANNFIFDLTDTNEISSFIITYDGFQTCK